MLQVIDLEGKCVPAPPGAADMQSGGSKPSDGGSKPSDSGSKPSDSGSKPSDSDDAGTGDDTAGDAAAKSDKSDKAGSSESTASAGGSKDDGKKSKAGSSSSSDSSKVSPLREVPAAAKAAALNLGKDTSRSCQCAGQAMELTCGNDGVTYTNPCLAKCLSPSGVNRPGPCESYDFGGDFGIQKVTVFVWTHDTIKVQGSGSCACSKGWQDAATCSQSVQWTSRDSQGCRWGWENSKSCSVKHSFAEMQSPNPSECSKVWQDAPTCSQGVQWTAKDRLGCTW